MDKLARLRRAYTAWMDADVGIEASKSFGRLESVLKSMEPANAGRGAQEVVLRSRTLLGIKGEPS